MAIGSSSTRSSGVLRAAARLLLIAALPLFGLQSLHFATPTVRAEGCSDALCEDVNRAGRRLARATKQAVRKGFAELTAHVISVHTGVPRVVLISRVENLPTVAPAALVVK